MRVGRKIALVGGIPILIAAFIAVAGWFLLAREEKARGGAILVGAIHHDLDRAATLRDRYGTEAPEARNAVAGDFSELTRRAGKALERLPPYAGTAAQAAGIASTRETLARFVAQMQAVFETTRARDAQTVELERSAGSLNVLADRAETAPSTARFALDALRLTHRAGDALRRRDADAAAELSEAGERLARAAASLPVPSANRDALIGALGDWRTRLAAAFDGLRRQDAAIVEADRLADALREKAQALKDGVIGETAGFDGLLQRLLLAAAAAGLGLAAIVAVLVARSILLPLRTLQADMITLAADPSRAMNAWMRRRDELGDIARATGFFVSEIARRENALRRSKDRADAALEDLRRTQDELVRSEKLASLGQLVAGVAHEINTPLGIALTTATSVRDETRGFKAVVATGTLSKARLTFFLGRVEEGAGLLCANLTRAADLVHGFKQVAVDRISDEQRSVVLKTWLDDLLASLQPLLRRGGHRIAHECPPDLAVETNPGALAQVVTNLINNAVVHAFEPGRSGQIGLRVERAGDTIRFDVADDGRGIAPGDLGRIFDPFFTTARGAGSTGLGMHIVHNLVTATLKGRITVESEPGRGTTVRIELPADETAGPGQPERRPAQPA